MADSESSTVNISELDIAQSPGCQSLEAAIWQFEMCLQQRRERPRLRQIVSPVPQRRKIACNYARVEHTVSNAVVSDVDGNATHKWHSCTRYFPHLSDAKNVNRSFRDRSTKACLLSISMLPVLR